MARAPRGRFEPLNHFVLGHLYDPWAPLCLWVAGCAHEVQSFDLSQTSWCRGLWALVSTSKSLAQTDKSIFPTLNYGMTALLHSEEIQRQSGGVRSLCNANVSLTGLIKGWFVALTKQPNA